MSKIIRNESIVDDAWQVLKLAEGESAETVALPGTPTLLPLAAWLARKAEILAGQSATGLWLDSHEGAEAIAGDLAHFSVIAINFPKFTDGRGYSIARLLRERYGFKGEIRAIGDVLQDQLFPMKRVGFNAYALPEGKNLDKALASLRVFSETYQAAVDQPQPLFRRRVSAQA